MSFPVLVPSALMTSSSVVHAVGAWIFTNGGWLTRRGAGAPVWPPAVCVKRTEPGLSSAPGRRSSNAVAARVMSWAPSLSVVAPIRPPPPWP